MWDVGGNAKAQGDTSLQSGYGQPAHCTPQGCQGRELQSAGADPSRNPQEDSAPVTGN